MGVQSTAFPNIRTPRLMLTVFLLSTCFSYNPAAHAQVTINTSTTLSADTTTANSVAPGTATDAVTLTADNLTVIIDANLTPGNGGNGANGGVNNGGRGGRGFYVATGRTNETVTFTAGKTIRGGAGGSGGDGSSSNGGAGGAAYNAISTSATNSNYTIYSNVITGNGGNGGAGNGGNNKGGNGGNSDTAIANLAAGSSFTIYGNVTGGNGGNGGTSVGSSTNSNGGTGGRGFSSSTDVTSFIVKSGSTITGGNGGAAGTGGSGTAGTTGAGAPGVVFTGSVGTVEIESGASVIGGLNSTGTVGAFALDFQGASVTSFTNAGTIKAGGTGPAVTIKVGSDITNFTNSATGIIGLNTATGAAVDISVSGSTITNFNNQGLLQGGTQRSLFVRTGGEITNLNNSGTIASVSGPAIELMTGSILGDLINSGTISTGDNVALNILSGSSIDSTINNTGGTISSARVSVASGTVFLGIDMAGKSITGGTISNSVANAVYSNVQQTGAFTLQDVTLVGNVNGGANDQHFIFSGTTSLTGDVLLGAGANSLGFNGTFTSGTGFDMTALGGTLAVSVGTSGDVTLNKAQAGANNISTLSVSTGGELNLNENFSGTGAVTNNGTIHIAGTKSLDMGNMVAGTGTWSFGLDDGLDAGLLNLTAAAVDFTGGTLSVDTTGLTTAITAGTDFIIADGVGAATVGALDNTLITDDSALLNFTLRRGDNSAVTTGGADSSQVYIEATALPVASVVAETPLFQTYSSSAIASILDSIGTSGGSDLDALQTRLQQAPTNEAVAHIINQLTPVDPVALINTHTSMNNSVITILGDRNAGVQGLSSAADDIARNNFFIEGFGQLAHQAKRGPVTGYHSRLSGIVAGYDRSLPNDKTTLGAAVAYAHSDTDMSLENNAVTTTNHYSMSLYGSHAFTPSLHDDFIITANYGQNDLYRFVLGEAVTAEQDSASMSFYNRLSYPIQIQNGPLLIPAMTASYNHYIFDDYAERGPLGVQVDSSSVHEFRLGLENTMAWSFIPPSHDITFKPRITIGFDAALLNKRTGSETRFVTAPHAEAFPLQNTDAGPATTYVRLGVDIFNRHALDISADYGASVAAGYVGHEARLRAGFKF